MTTLRERIGPDSYMDDEGDILPYADVADDFDRPPVSDESIVQGMENLRHAHDRDAEIDAYEAEQKLAKLTDKNPGPHVTLEQYYQDQLDLLDFVSGSIMRRGFKKGGSRKPEVIERYGENLPQVEAGAHGNHKKLVHKELPRIYHADELIEAGFEPQEVQFDAITTMRSEAQSQYGGPENKAKRAKRRKELKQKLSHYASK